MNGLKSFKRRYFDILNVQSSMSMLTRCSLIVIGMFVLLTGCRKDVAMVSAPEDERTMRWTWEVLSPDTLRLTTGSWSGSVWWCSPDEEGLEQPLCVSVYLNGRDVDPGTAIDWRFIVMADFHSQGGGDSVGTVVTSHLGACDIPLMPGSTVTQADRVFYRSTLHDDRPGVDCIDGYPVRHIGFVRLRNGVKQAGYARVGSKVDATGVRLYWIEKVCFSKVPWSGIRILD